MNRTILLLALLSTACTSIGRHDVRPLDVPPTRPTTWEDVFARPARLRVTAFVTGEVFTGTQILIEGDHPRTPEAQKKDQWVPALAYLVEHPTQGRILFDTGVPRPDAEGRCDFGRWPLFSVPCRAAPHQNAADQLAARGLSSRDLRFVVMSHFHGDHVGGLSALQARGPVPVLTTEDEWRAVGRTFPVFEGYLGEFIDGTYPVLTLPQGRAVEMPLVGAAVDLLGDGAIWLLSAAGHSRGQLAAVLNAEGGPLLLTFDAAHLAASVELGIPPGFTVNRDEALATIGRLAALKNAYPKLCTYYGHEPTQWVGTSTATVLTR